MPDLRESFKNVRPATQCSRRDYVYHVNGRGARGVAEKLRVGSPWWAVGSTRLAGRRLWATLSACKAKMHGSFASLRMTKRGVSGPRRKLPAGLDLNGVTGLEFGIVAALPKDGESGYRKPKIASLTRADRGVDRIVHQLPCGCGGPDLQGEAFLAEAGTDYAFLIGVHQFEWLVENQNHGSATQEVACATANEMTMIKVAGVVFRLKGRSSRHFGSGFGEHGESLRGRDDAHEENCDD